MISRAEFQNNLNILTDDILVAKKYPQPLPNLGTQNNLLAKIQKLNCNLTPDYLNDFWKPAQEFIKKKKFSTNVTSTYYLTAQALLQHSSGQDDIPLKLMQRFVCDMWNTFVDNSQYCPIDTVTLRCLSPIAIWGPSSTGPFSCNKHPVRNITLGSDCIPIVSFPSDFKKVGLMAWTVLGHETAHTIMESGQCCRKGSFQTDVTNTLERHLDPNLVTLWTQWLSEAVADVMNVLYMGPTAAFGLIIFLRAHRKDNRLSNSIVDGDPHPPDILRAILVAYVVKYLGMVNSAKWKKSIKQTVKQDFSHQILGMGYAYACETTEEVALAIINARVAGNKPLWKIQEWSEQDEEHTYSIIKNQNIKSDMHLNVAHIISAMCTKALFDNSLRINPQQTTSKLVEDMFKKFNVFQLQNECDHCPLASQEKTPWCPLPDPDKALSRKSNQITSLAVSFGAFGAALGLVVLFGMNNGKK